MCWVIYGLLQGEVTCQSLLGVTGWKGYGLKLKNEVNYPRQLLKIIITVGTIIITKLFFMCYVFCMLLFKDPKSGKA